MVPERKLDGNFEDREKHGESNIWSTTQRQEELWISYSFFLLKQQITLVYQAVCICMDMCS